MLLEMNEEKPLKLNSCHVFTWHGHGKYQSSKINNRILIVYIDHNNEL